MTNFLETMRKKYKHSIFAVVYRFFRYSFVDTVRNRLFYTLVSGRIKKALYYPFKSIIIKVQKRPKAIIIDTVSVCNLRCPMCSVPPDISRKSTESKYMNIDKYKKIIDNIDGYVTDLTLVYSGEPLLHPKFIDVVRYPANTYYITTISNATVFKKGVLDAILKYVDTIFFSYDGFSKESFEKYRIGADFDEVTRNIENLLIERKKYRRGIPIVILTWLVNSYNEHEVDKARLYWLDKGVDKFFEKPINLNIHRRDDDKKESDFEHWLPKENAITLYEQEIGGNLAFVDKEYTCNIWSTPVIRGDGEILLCCHDLSNSVKIGNVGDKKFSDIWEDKDYRKIQAIAKKRGFDICKVCGK